MASDTSLAFTEKRLAELKPPEKGRKYYRDEKCQGLQVCVTSKGAKSFYFRQRTPSGQHRLKIGQVGKVTLKTARDRANELRGQVAVGRDPAEDYRARKGEPNLADAFDHWMKYADQHKKPKSAAEDRRQYKVFFKQWQRRRIASLKPVEVSELHAKIGRENGPYAANRALALFRSMLNKAQEIGWNGPDPSQGVRKFKEQSRDRFLDGAEIKAFFQALDDEPSQLMQDLFRVLLFTGARRSNVCAMKWADVNLERGLWRIPETETKGGLPILVTLSDPVREILEQRLETARGEYVFPSHGRTGHVVEIKEAWKRIINRAGLENVRPHDLRRTLASWQALSGASELIIGKALGHAPGSKATSVYARLNTDPVKASIDIATTALLEAAKPEEDEKEVAEEDHE